MKTMMFMFSLLIATIANAQQQKIVDMYSPINI